MGSPKRHNNNLNFTPLTYHVDWDSPSTKTGTVKRRPNSCGDALKLINFDDEPEFEGSRQCLNDRKISLDLSVQDKDKEEQINHLNNSIEVEEKIDKILNNVEKIPSFCKQISVEDHKFLVDKSGKITPDTATLFPKKVIESKLKPPKIMLKSYDKDDVIKDNSESKITTKSVISKLKLSFSPSKTNPEKSRFRMFTTKPSYRPKQSTLASLNKEVIDNEYVNPARTRNSSIKRVPSKIPITPVDNDNKLVHLSPNKKYTVTSKHGIRCDKEHYAVYDPESGFGNKIGKKSKKESVSDTDSGILSPTSPMDSNLEIEKIVLADILDNKNRGDVTIVPDFTVTHLKHKIDEQEKIYTDWANHYLERGRSGRRVRQLAECGDGKLLRDLLEAVTGQRVPDCRGHQNDDITACLQFLSAQRVQGLEQVTAAELRQGRLRAILALFFALSRHKQASKQHRNATCDSNINLAARTMGATACDDLGHNGVGQNRQTSKAVAAAAGTAIPLPRRTRPLPPTPGSKGGSTVSGSSSRSSSPIQQTPSITSPRIQQQHQTQINNHGSRPNSSLITPGSKIPSSPYCGQPASPGAPAPPPHQAQSATTKHSMLDKLKLFKDKSSSERHKNNPTISKRTSSSSGFSSAKSERSDSSLSLNESHTINNSHIKGPNCITKQVLQTDISKDNQKQNKNLKSKLAPSKQQKDPSAITKPQKNEKSSKNSPKLQAKDKESKIAPPKTTLNAKPLAADDNLRQTKISVKQDTKISRLSGSQMKLCGDQRIPSEGIANKLSPTDPKVIQTSIQTPKINSTCNGIANSNSTSFAANNVPAQCQNSTGIPKPTAAVKGTSKIPKDEKAAMSLVKSNSNISQMSPSQSNSTLMTNSTGSTTLPFNRELSSLTKENCQKQTLIVSPMPNSNSDNQSVPVTALNPAISSQMSESSNSNSTHSASTGPHSNSSDGSVIYRPSSESGSEMSKLRHNPIPNRKIDVTAQFMTEMISETQIIDKTDPKKNVINNTIDPKLKELNDRRIENVRNCNSPMHSKENSLGEEDNPSMNVLPMRPLLRGYNSHLTLPARSPSVSTKNGITQNFPHHANTVKANFGRENLNPNYGMRDRNNVQYMPMGYAGSEYCDLDIAAGYMSEGDCMRRLAATDPERERSRAIRIGDVLDGYMSEGGASLYGRRNYPNGQVPQQQFDDRTKVNGGPNCINRGPDFIGGIPQNRQTMEQQHQGTPIYRLTPSRNKKTDSSQQTDTSNYKIINTNGHSSKNGDSQWKKYTDSPGVGSPVQSGTPTSPISARRRGASGTQPAGQRPKQTERLTAAQQLGATAPPPHQMHFGSLSGGQHSSKSGGQLQSPGSVSSQSSNRSSIGNANPHMVPGANIQNTPVSGNGGGRVKGVPQSFGYVKRPGGQTNATNGQQTHQNMNLGQMQGGRTAQVSAVPRTKVKVSGGTQTCTQDLQIHKGGAGVKSFSLSGSAASQLSQSVRERLMLGSQSLPKPGSHDFAVLFQHHRVPPRGGMKISDGSLSDTQTYSDVKSDYGSPYTSWLRHSNTYSASGRLSECDSMESLQSLQPTGSARVPAPPRLLHQTPPSRLNRSNSIRSTKSEKLYPSMLQRSSEGDYEPYYCLPVNYGDGQGLAYGTSEPPSPSPRSAMSPPPHGHPHGNAVPQHPLLLPSSHHSVRHSHHYKKNDDAHGSTASLVSTASSLHSSAEERQAHEARKLRRELTDAKDKVHTLTTQLTTNAHVVSAFEQSLSNMTQRLQQLTATAERKDSELTQLRQTIELLRKQSIQAGLTSAHMTSMGIKQDSVTESPKQNSIKQNNITPSATNGSSNMTRHHSTDSVSSLNSLSSGCSSAQDKKQKKKGWLRSSFTKAFSRNAKISKTAKHSSLSHLSSSSQEHSSIGGDHHTIREGSNENSLENSHEILADLAAKGEKIDDKSKIDANSDAADPDKCDPELVDELKKQLREKDLVLTDIRLEALSSAHQLESLKDTVIKMRNEMLNLKQNNERLQRLVRPRSLAGSHASLSGATPPGPAPSGNTPLGSGSNDDGRRFSAADAQRSNNDNHQQLELDFKCITSTPTLEYGSKMQSPCDRTATDIYRASQDLSLSALEDNDLMNGSPGIDDDPLLTGGRLSGVDCDISSVLPPPKCRELAMGETYPDLGLTENSVDVVDGKKIAISVYLGQPETFSHYFEEICESLNNCENHYYSNRSSVAFSSHPQDLQDAPSSPRVNHIINNSSSPDREINDFQNSKSNTNSLKSNKSAHSNAFKNNYNGTDAAVNCNEFVIAYTYISGKTTWQNLDYTVRKTFKDYLSRIDPGTNLGLNTDSITSYHLGEATRGPEIGFPELLPCGYIIGTVRTLYICLQGVGSLAFDSLIPKNIVYRYVSLLSEHRRVILCGPSGTGKSYLAARLAEFHVSRTAAHLNPAEAIATFNVEHKSSKELRQYLSNMVEQCGGDAALPSVLILDNLHHASALADVFSGLLGARRTNLPCIIGTMSQATCNTTNLQLHHNFRWLLTANHMEPVKGFLARYLRRKQLMGELSGVPRCPRIGTILEWLPVVWQHVNSFLEAHSSSDVTVGPRLFLGCPLDMIASQLWFTNVWNQSVVPYLVEAAREGVALYGRRGAWSDPVKYVRDTYPWADQQPAETLRGITLEDIGLDGNTSDTTANNNQDPLLNMLMRLREAANYSGNHSQDSDNASLDSNMTHDSSVGNEL